MWPRLRDFDFCPSDSPPLPARPALSDPALALLRGESGWLQAVPQSLFRLSSYWAAGDHLLQRADCTIFATADEEFGLGSEQPLHLLFWISFSKTRVVSSFSRQLGAPLKSRAQSLFLVMSETSPLILFSFATSSQPGCGYFTARTGPMHFLPTRALMLSPSSPINFIANPFRRFSGRNPHTLRLTQHLSKVCHETRSCLPDTDVYVHVSICLSPKSPCKRKANLRVLFASFFGRRRIAPPFFSRQTPRSLGLLKTSELMDVFCAYQLDSTPFS